MAIALPRHTDPSKYRYYFNTITGKSGYRPIQDFCCICGAPKADCYKQEDAA